VIGVARKPADSETAVETSLPLEASVFSIVVRRVFDPFRASAARKAGAVSAVRIPFPECSAGSHQLGPAPGRRRAFASIHRVEAWNLRGQARLGLP
jgi:hypothetical protein